MKTLENLIDIFGATENNQLMHKGRFVNLHNSKRSNWNNRRNYGL
jgi:hypothetical protein